MACGPFFTKFWTCTQQKFAIELRLPNPQPDLVQAVTCSDHKVLVNVLTLNCLDTGATQRHMICK
jgi:hypothetical protein